LTIDFLNKYNIKNNLSFFNMKNSKNRIQKMITFPTVMYSVLEKKAESLGLNTPEYIRYLIINDIKSSAYNIPLLTQTLEEAKTEYKLGRTRSISGKSALKKRFSEIQKYAESRK